MEDRNIDNFLLPNDGVPGQFLHEAMRQAVNSHDKVILICSKQSLDRTGVLNEIEETLRRESREGGRSILVPITLDDYVFNEWAPAKSDHQTAVLDRIVGDFRNTPNNSEQFDKQFGRLLTALERTE
ncbi:MAG: toll/interleukin-1 receptor domain-containing protein [Bacteroidetes bacterium]|nr:toll/interleukin-1 receptor domain-containing protein [Bacteroidota bacterium]